MAGLDDAQLWQLYVKDMVGATTTVSVHNPQDLTVLGLKKLIHEQRPDLPPYKQKLVCRSSGPRPLEDERKLASFPGLQNRSVINLIVQVPWEIYLQAADGKLHTVEIPSSNPNDFHLTEMRSLSEGICNLSLNEYQFCLGQKVLDDSRHGRMMTLGDHGITARDTLVLLKVGFTLNITNPKVDLCFLVDCTGSMGSWIQTVKDNIMQLRDKLEEEYQGCDLQFAFVRYTDYDQPASSRTTWINFTNSASAFRAFVSGIAANGGGDGPEDIMGGLNAVFTQLYWRQESTKVHKKGWFSNTSFKTQLKTLLTFRPDALAFFRAKILEKARASGRNVGKVFNRVLKLVFENHPFSYMVLIHIADCPCHGVQYHSMSDNHPNGDPAGISHEAMMQKVAQKQVQYWFGYIAKESTDKMITVFNESLRRLSSQCLMIRQFDAKEPQEVGTAVHKSVTASVVGSEARKVASADSWILDPTVPTWTSLPELSALKAQPPGLLSLADLQRQDVSLPNPSMAFHYKCAAAPFAVGEEAVVFHALETRTSSRIVMKELHTKKSGSDALQACKTTAEMQLVASVYAREFTEDPTKPRHTPNVAYIGCDVIQCSNGKCYLVEQLLEGSFEKFSNNFGVVRQPGSPLSDVLQAFSHYTWAKSGQSILICDHQGVQTPGGGVTLTDPAMHSCGPGGKYGPTDQGRNGVQRFFKTHACNDICQRMNLRARI